MKLKIDSENSRKIRIKRWIRDFLADGGAVGEKEIWEGLFALFWVLLFSPIWVPIWVVYKILRFPIRKLQTWLNS